MKRVLKFYSPTCGPCKVMSKKLEEVSKVTGVEVQDVDITDEDNESLIDEWKPRTVPTIIVMDTENNAVTEFKGIVPAEKIIEAING